ncbi:hypothetical protein VX159_00610 [Dechloromonas sp. ZY10]|uniref:hypothetical protein n=1 Tax=Dechloromonas aquae TaxID=2664436 RepID=UPI0035282C12
MNSSSDRVSAIVAALRAKREAQTSHPAADLAALENSLLAEIEAFDPARARPAQEIPPPPPARAVPMPAASAAAAIASPPPASTAPPVALTGGLLEQLRQQASVRQREENAAATSQATSATAIDRALNLVFRYLHELVQQLNILKPKINRDYQLLNQLALHGLHWQEGFADYRRQPDSEGALLERVSFTCRLGGAPNIACERDDTNAERFRALLFDLGLNFSSQEFRNDKRLIERVRFEIRGELGVSVRWRADFARGLILIEARNLERFGAAPYELAAAAVDQALLDEFGRLLLGQPNRFRELARRR